MSSESPSHVAALITLALTWDYLKAANRVAAAALEADIYPTEGASN
jgi:hypothetical protein